MLSQESSYLFPILLIVTCITMITFFNNIFFDFFFYFNITIVIVNILIILIAIRSMDISIFE